MDAFWWTATANADGANGLNCKSLAGLDVEKLRGEGTSTLTRSVAHMVVVYVRARQPGG